MGFFRNLFAKKDSKSLLEGVTLFDCIDDLLNNSPQEVSFSRAKLFQKNFDLLSTEPGSYISLFFTLLHYYELVPQDMNIVASNITSGVHDLICEANDQDPYAAKRSFERLFTKWPEALNMAQNRALKEETEENLVFLASIQLFGWVETAIPTHFNECVDKLGKLDTLKKPEAFKWLKAQLK